MRRNGVREMKRNVKNGCELSHHALVLAHVFELNCRFVVAALLLVSTPLVRLFLVFEIRLVDSV